MADKDEVISQFDKALQNSDAWPEFSRWVVEEGLPRIAIASRLKLDVRTIRVSDYDQGFIDSCVADLLEKRSDHPAPVEPHA